MSRLKSIQKFFAFAFAAIVVFIVSVHETHYLFTEHHLLHEHCENHLHSEEEHSDCAVCKFDVSFFTNHLSHPESVQQIFISENVPLDYPSVVLSAKVSANALRGPPSST